MKYKIRPIPTWGFQSILLLIADDCESGVRIEAITFMADTNIRPYSDLILTTGNAQLLDRWLHE